MRKRLVTTAMMALFISCLAFGVSVEPKNQVPNSFDSFPMLDAYYDEDMPSGQEGFWSDCRIFLITIGEGDPLYSWFGHTALLVESPDNPSYMFDYGTFSFDADNFYRNFIMGRLWFCCNVSYGDYELSYLGTTGRKVSKVELNLTASQKKAVISFLNVNSKADNRTYLYHHYNDNCATRVRDIISYATGGDFETWARANEGLSFRKRASGALSRSRFVQWALEFLQSGQIDGKATAWEEMFLPELLERYVLEYGLETGLVSQDGYELMYEETLKSAGGNGAEPRPNYVFSVALGLALAILAFVLLWFSQKPAVLRTYRIYSFAVDLVLGIFGSVLFFMMFFTNHNVTWYNENLLFVNPLLFVMAIKSLGIKSLGTKDASSDKAKRLSWWYKVLLCIMAVLAILKVILPGVFLQENWTVIIAMAPYYAVNAFLLGRERS